MMKIDEAIQHAESVANSSCNECANDHRQLAEWLKELKRRRKEECHGRWIDYQHGSGAHCSCCNFKIRYKDKNRFKFCPNCGAIMDEESKDES